MGYKQEVEKLYNYTQKTSDKKKLIRALEKLWTIAVYEKEGERCIVCGKPATATHHIIRRRRSLSLKYDVKNGVPLCAGCHMKLHLGEPEPQKAILEHIGDERYNYLQVHKNSIFKNSLTNLREKARILRDEIK